MFAAQYYHFDKPRQWINSGGLGTMGFGLPSAMGVQLAFPTQLLLVLLAKEVFRCVFKNFQHVFNMDCQ